MAFGLYQITMCVLLTLVYISTFAATEDVRASMCLHFQKCSEISPLCFLLLFFYRCTDPTPSCGFSSVTGNASRYPGLRLVGGTEALDREFPWSVHLYKQGRRKYECGASIISKNSILTAAHCVSDVIQRPGALSVGYGSTNKSSLTYVEAKEIAVHPAYNASTYDNDVAVVTVSEPLPLNASTNLRSICLPDADATYEAGTQCIVTGWGFTEEQGPPLPDALQKVSVPLIPLNICRDAYSEEPVVLSERQICAGYYTVGGKDACKGDSGGPLFCADGDRWVQYGIVSAGKGCARALYPGIYSYVPQHIEWINSHIVL
ncbi:serine protease 27-like isoform X1 [Haliotis rufescens]|uniref:serine protease 27-like isoform X1 n=1 Tax=Haliotis rufescens TaxID=6454 RepID=UPI00201E85BF|nr:serine protease 27-like isoform X1 [Haliotis rufescens]